MEITGGCFCRAITYRAEIDETRIGICHCRDCQIFSGSAFRMSSLIDPDKFEFLTGTPRRFNKTGDSGKERTMAFCGECGTHLCSLPVGSDQDYPFVSLRIASADQFPQLQPLFELYCKSQVSWLPALENTGRFEKMMDIG